MLSLLITRLSKAVDRLLRLSELPVEETPSPEASPPLKPADALDGQFEFFDPESYRKSLGSGTSAMPFSGRPMSGQVAHSSYDMTQHVAFSNIPGVGRPFIKDVNGFVVLTGPWKAEGEELEVRKALTEAINATKAMKEVKREIWQGEDPDVVLAKLDDVKEVMSAGRDIIQRYEQKADEFATSRGFKPTRPANFRI